MSILQPIFLPSLTRETREGRANLVTALHPVLPIPFHRLPPSPSPPPSPSSPPPPPSSPPPLPHCPDQVLLADSEACVFSYVWVPLRLALPPPPPLPPSPSQPRSGAASRLCVEMDTSKNKKQWYSISKILLTILYCIITLQIWLLHCIECSQSHLSSCPLLLLFLLLSPDQVLRADCVGIDTS